MSDTEVRVIAHNPMTGPRHLAHYICIKDYLAQEQQEGYASFYVVDDLAAYVMYPASREKVLNRAFFTIRDFLAAGVDPGSNHLVLTSMLAEAHELNVLFNMHVDWQYCYDLYKESFCGRLVSYQREQIGFNKYPSVTEVIHTQTALAALTLGLQAEEFTGGEEMLGYMPIMRDIVENFNKAYGEVLELPEMDLVRYPFVLGTDGRHMMNDNALFLASPANEVREVVGRVSDYAVLRQWYGALDAKDWAKKLPPSGVPSAADREKAASFFVDALERFRKYKISNAEILEIVRGGVVRARDLLSETVLRVRGAIGMPPGF